MPENQASEDFFRKRFLDAILVVGLTLSIILFGGSFSVDEDPYDILMKEVAMILLGAVLVTYAQQHLLREYFRQEAIATIKHGVEPALDTVQTELCEAIEGIVPEVQEQTRASLDKATEAIYAIQTKVAEATRYMEEGINVLSGAKLAGIVNIFPTRYREVSGVKAADVIAEDIQNEIGCLRLMGISLGDFLLDRGALHDPFEALLKSQDKSSLKIQILLAHPQDQKMRERARWEAGETFFEGNSYFDSTTYIETDGTVRIAKHLCRNHPNRLSARLYKQAPTTYVLLTNQFAFVESYNYADRGGHSPVLQIQSGSALYAQYEKHFENIWNAAESIDTYDPLRPDPQ